MQTYLFYDIETTGLSKPFDQVLQFAGVRTDLNLNEIERYEIKVKLNKDVIPSPRAVITHHIGVQEAQSGIAEHIAIKQIHELLNTPGTISLGYNTLGFDDEFLRFCFYRNLLSPYTHQFANQCSRMDIYPMALMYFLYKNDVITWPIEEGKVSLKLEKINAYNQLARGQAHNAMVDVDVTIALARKFFAAQEMWKYLQGYFNKISDDKRSQNLTQQTALMIYGKIGSEKFFQSPVLFLGQHRHYKNQSIWLRLDTQELQNTTLDSINTTTWAIRKKSGEPGFILPLEEKYLKNFSMERAQLFADNKQWLENHPEIFQAISNYHLDLKYPVYPNTDIDASLYLNGFLSSEEQRFCQQFHAAPPKQKASLANSLKNSNLKILATRFLGRHFPEVMTGEQAEYFKAYLDQLATQDVIDYRGEKRLTADVALKDIQELRQEKLTEKQVELLDELEVYLKSFEIRK